MLKERRFSDDIEYEYEEAYPLRRKMEFLVKKINGWKSLTIFTKITILDVWQHFGYNSGMFWKYSNKDELVCSRKLPCVVYDATAGKLSKNWRSFFCSVFSCIQSEYRKIRNRKNSVFGHFSGSMQKILQDHLFTKAATGCVL